MVQPQHISDVVINVFHRTVLLVVRDQLGNQCSYVVDKMTYFLEHNAALVLFGELLQQVK